MYDIVLKNGYLTDIENGLNGQKRDIGIKDGTIVEIGDITNNYNKVLNLDGLNVTPGLIDFHAHFFDGGANTSLKYSLYSSTGVTYACDAGSAGDSNIESFINSLTEFEKRNSSLFIYLASEGQACLGNHLENINPIYFNEDKIYKLCNKYSNLIKGLKIRISHDVAKFSNTTSFDALIRAVEISERCNLPLSVHMPDYEGDLKTLIDILRPGDIFCHVYTPKKGILENGKVSKEMFRAREKGIYLESACGKGHFGHECAKIAIDSGLYPDIISGDFTKNTFNYEPAMSLTYLMSRFIALGMTFEDVLKCVTTVPAKILNYKDKIGCLKVGAKANITVIDRYKTNISFEDADGVKVNGQELLIPEITIMEGEIVYRNVRTSTN